MADPITTSAAPLVSAPIAATAVLLGDLLASGAGLWLGVRLVNGWSERNTLAVAAQWMLLLRLLAVPALLVPFLIPFDAVVLFIVLWAILLRYYELSLWRAFLTLFGWGIITAVINALLLLGACGVGYLAAEKEGALRVIATLRLGQRALVGQEDPAPPPAPPPAAPQRRGARRVDGLWTFVDERGTSHVVDSIDKVPERYR